MSSLNGTAYQLIRSSRKTVAIQITRQGEVIVRAPRSCPQPSIDAFVMEKQAWIERKLREIKQREEAWNREVNGNGGTCGQNSRLTVPTTLAEEQVYRMQAAEIFGNKAAYYAARMGVNYNRITIRDQKTRWGSCSGNGNLNFNWRLVLAPVAVLDYVVVHELAHRREMNHSSRFWSIVEDIMPDYRTHRNWLRDHGNSLMEKVLF